MECISCSRATISPLGDPILRALIPGLWPEPARQSGNTVGSIRNVAVSALTKNLADELGPHGINVTVVHPGTTRT